MTRLSEVRIEGYTGSTQFYAHLRAEICRREYVDQERKAVSPASAAPARVYVEGISTPASAAPVQRFVGQIGLHRRIWPTKRCTGAALAGALKP